MASASSVPTSQPVPHAVSWVSVVVAVAVVDGHGGGHAHVADHDHHDVRAMDVDV